MSDQLIPDTLDNGAKIMEFTLHHIGGNGWRPNGVALCSYKNEYVTWTVYEDDNGNWQPTSGNYFDNLLDAVKDYTQRSL